MKLLMRPYKFEMVVTEKHRHASRLVVQCVVAVRARVEEVLELAGQKKRGPEVPQNRFFVQFFALYITRPRQLRY